MNSRLKYTERKLTYDHADRLRSVNVVEKKVSQPLDLPPEFEKKISSTEHKKIQQAFFIEADPDLTITKKKFPIVMRSLGIILNTGQFNIIFD